MDTNSGSKPPAPESPDYIRVEAERMDESTRGGGMPYGQPPAFPPLRPPVVTTWLCLFLAWMFLGSALPLTIFIGLPLNIAALVLALVCLTRSAAFTGILVLLLGTAGSIMVYMVGLFRFLGAA